MPLTNEQKHYIQQEIVNYEDNKEFLRVMSKELDVTQKVVSEYITELVRGMLKTEANVQKEERKAAKTAEKYFSESVLQQVKSSLRKAGLNEDHVSNLMRRALSKMEITELPSDESQQVNLLYNHSLAQLNSSDVMIKETKSGRKGVTVMTEAASGRSDDEMKASRYVTYKSRGSMYTIDGEEITEIKENG
jgi:hypothetical protein